MSDNDVVIGLATIVVFGVGAQWIGRRVGIPSLLLLLPAGVLAGPVLELVEPEELFGELLFPGITLLVSLLLFQAALGLDLRKLPRVARRPVLRLVTIGAAVTFAGAAAGAGLLLDLPTDLAFLTGAILVVSGPTVVGPLLRALRPRDPSDSVLNWESIALDPIGATLGVVVLNLVLASGGDVHPAFQMLSRFGVGVGVGCAAAGLLVLVMSRFLVTAEMEAAVALLFAIAAFTVADTLLSEAGLFATTTLGFIAANQDLVPTTRIKGFGETLEVVIIGSLFIVLGALVTLDELADFAWESVLLVALLVLLIRPLAVGLSLMGTDLRVRERAFVACVDPRGIVAAATAAQFTGSLADAHIRHTFLLPVVFGVIIGTGVIYASVAAVAAGRLGVRRPAPTGVAVVGREPWALALGHELHKLGVPLLVLTTDDPAAPLPDELPSAVFEDEDALGDAVEAASIAQALVVAPPDPAVTLLTANLVELLGRHRVLDVRDGRARSRRRVEPATARAFGADATRERIDALRASGAIVETRDQAPDGDGLLLATVAPDRTVDLRARARTVPEGTAYIGLFPPGAARPTAG